MLRLIPALALLAAVPLAAQTPAPAPALPPLDAEASAQLTCAAAFAIVALEQRRGERAALAFPPLGVRGKEYFVRVGARTMDATGASRETMKALFEREVARLQQQAAAGGDPDATAAAVAQPCLARLDAEVPPLPKPDLPKCTAILALASEEMTAKVGLAAPAARDLKILASVLESRQRKALQEQGLSGDQSDRRIAEAHDAMLQEVLADPAGVEKYDLQTCYDFAKPEPGKHY